MVVDVVDVWFFFYFVLPIFLYGCIYVVLRGTSWLIDRLEVWRKRFSGSAFSFLMGVVLGLLGVGFTFSFTVGVLVGGLLLIFLMFPLILILLFAVTAVKKPIHCVVLVVGFAAPLALFLWLNFSIGAVIGAVIVTGAVVSAVMTTYFMELKNSKYGSKFNQTL